MKKMDALKSIFKKNISERDKTLQSLEGLRAAVNEANKSAETAAAAGDVDEYMSMKEKADRAAAVLHVAEARSKAPVVVDREAAEEAWKEYEKEYNVRMAEALAKIEKAKQTFVTTFEEAAAMQDEALTVRKECTDMCGMDEQAFSLGAKIGFPGNEVTYRAVIDFVLVAQGINILSTEATGPKVNYYRIIHNEKAKG